MKPMKSKKDEEIDGKVDIKFTPNEIKNKARRVILWNKLRQQTNKEKSERRRDRLKEAKKLGDQAPAKLLPRTIERLRKGDETIVQDEDEEVSEDVNLDEFASYFDGKEPKVCITTNTRPQGRHITPFVKMIEEILPNCEYFPRKDFKLKDIVKFCANRDYTDLLVVNEDNGVVHTMMMVHLPYGPTVQFRVTNITMPDKIENCGKMTSHKPELIINNFTTRLGLTVGRMFASMFPQDPNFKGRRVVTLHNQRDFIFFRHHRYEFASNEKAYLQELGPRFTLKLMYLQKGTFDATGGEYIHLHKADMDVDRKTFVL
ncbi:brix domain-containing protein [Cavenderia fasciculata]|uniref:Brix domain-containing protein n=1 Tax=Cavenderia fasciculata TaxID=261658 RepID=F4PWJ7_CACFS|nr:brix domain-containing protein [Cavenderia fasciculata]EGG20361.1 brix domain-containing protein [Cavenderia fasciculata]|eukprot:XP_004367344.1 brix domain-containing protein [Cavenderia fasciculata]